MFEEIKNIQSEKSDLRKFGITIGVILLVIAGFLFWKEKESYKLFLAIGSTLLLTAIALPSVLKPVYWIWMILATILGYIQKSELYVNQLEMNFRSYLRDEKSTIHLGFIMLTEETQ